MSAAAAVFHCTLSPAPSALPLAAARVTDRQRFALLLEGAALLSLLEHAGWWLPQGWDGARVAAGGRLVLGARAAAPGRPPRPAQEQLRELLLRLFGDPGADPGTAAVCGDGDGPDGGGGAALGAGLIAGRGEARRAARALLADWWQPLVPLPADEAVARIVASAPFLWSPAFAAARQALAGEVRGAAGTGLWVAGPGASRVRLLAGAGSSAELAARLGGEDARAWWEGDDAAPASTAAGVSPFASGTAGRRWRALAAAAGSHPPVSEAGRLELAAALVGLGRFTAALAALTRSRSPAGRLLRVRCQLHLGSLGAARVGLRRLAALPATALTAGEAIDAAEMAVRVFANSGEPGCLPHWVESALAAGRTAGGPELARGHLVAALAAWDRQQPAAMDDHLEAAGEALRGSSGGLAVAGMPATAALQAWWRLHQARGLRAMAAGDGAAMAEHLGRALRSGRRDLAHHEAGGLWNDLGIGRAQKGDLAGAERAFLHAQRLFGGGDGPRRTTLALHNLAEVRLRRGRTDGVREILSRSTAENRRGGNLRGLSQDAELWARLELVLGRPEEAAALCRSAMDRLDRRRSQWRRGVLAVLRARALGWLERQAEAAAQLAGATPQAVAELEPEERPALWAHAGERDAARRLAATLESPAAGLWRAVLAGDAVPVAEWQALAAFEPYRAARLVFDLERAAASALLAPPDWRRAAIATLRRVGATALAAWLEARDAGPWQALASYAARPAGDLQAIAALLRRAGDPEARLSWTVAGDEREASSSPPAGTGGGSAGPPAGTAGGSAGTSGEPSGREASSSPAGAGDLALLAADLPAGRLELRCRRVDPALTSCFALAVRDLAAAAGAPPAPPAASAPGAPSAAAPDLAAVAIPPASSADEVAETAAAPATSLIGSSPILRTAVARLLRIAAVDIPVLIQGESGTGKELAAREIHRASARARFPFLPLNCAALAESLLFSDLFGHVRGAFTGADRDRAGVFEAARGGTVLLDEIGDLPFAAQGLLLRVMQESEVRRLGENAPRRVDVRVLAATHHDLERSVAAGTFREDLFYRLKVGAVELPPLRERADDLLELADLFLARQPFTPAPRLSAAARERLRRHAWPGNIRELENVLRLAAALAAGGVIEAVHLELPDAAAAVTGAAGGAPGAPPTASRSVMRDVAAPAAAPYHQQVESLRRRLLSEAIAAAGGNHAEAARRLGLSRQALSYLVRQLGLR